MSPREQFRIGILSILREHDPLKTKQIYRYIKELYPILCDDRICCTCGGVKRNSPEWKHQLRWAQQDLKKNRKIKLECGLWLLV